MYIHEGCERFIAHATQLERSPGKVQQYRRSLNRIRKFAEVRHNRPLELDELQLTDYDEFFQHLRYVEGCSPNVRNNILWCLRSFYKVAVRYCWCQDNLALKMEAAKEVKRERQCPSELDIRKLFRGIQHPLIKLVVQFVYYTGTRITECLSLPDEAIDLEQRTILVLGKGNKERIIPLTSSTLCSQIMQIAISRSSPLRVSSQHRAPNASALANSMLSSSKQLENSESCASATINFVTLLQPTF